MNNVSYLVLRSRDVVRLINIGVGLFLIFGGLGSQLSSPELF
jgi:hypothetical protein